VGAARVAEAAREAKEVAAWAAARAAEGEPTAVQAAEGQPW
jgi:hypothetical protein